MFADLHDEMDRLRRHITVFRLVCAHEPIGIHSLSKETDLPVNRVRTSLRYLEDEGYIEPTPEGAVTTDRAGSFERHLAPELDAIVEALEGLETAPPIPG